ncbi:hypothetical protein GUJ93_ZPchr0014g47360 [Zizania palustris]|uniref:Uncharacterized protein n=1 Tax=Zizania palustris TaxID=103762 RepID=A0A8J5SVB0_ZIZPA|nr:hypothetical protein GUJ93_ZPchr0014g47360 [Zizania palustris]
MTYFFQLSSFFSPQTEPAAPPAAGLRRDRRRRPPPRPSTPGSAAPLPAGIRQTSSRPRSVAPPPRPTPSASSATDAIGLRRDPPRRSPSTPGSVAPLHAGIRRACVPLPTAPPPCRAPSRRTPPRLLPAGHRAPLRPSPGSELPFQPVCSPSNQVSFPATRMRARFLAYDTVGSVSFVV